ncbi:Panacea domain-containing protein [Sphingomonas daechungensis]|uniref:Panacea domain-containing protein n=1 Tax=Sphingomonas daechungensis TaxID=1176646 RepID=UPI003783A53E
MPAWSPVIANEFIKLAAEEGRTFNQMQLQELVYIAHGWCLAIAGQPLTGDRPEAHAHGPEYRRLADALIKCGVDPVTEIPSETDATLSGAAELSEFEQDIVERIYADYGKLDIRHLAIVTRAKGTPWDKVYADGVGKNRDISHTLIKAQFDDVATKLIS